MKLMVVDDHALVRQGVSALFERESPGAVLLQARDSAEGLQLAAAHDDLDAVFLDLSMPGLDGIDALREFARVRPDLPVIVLTAADDPALARRAFDAGALGYVPKSASAETLVTALTLVLRGETEQGVGEFGGIAALLAVHAPPGGNGLLGPPGIVGNRGFGRRRSEILLKRHDHNPSERKLDRLVFEFHAEKGGVS